MIEVKGKRMVITRKVHQCFGCEEDIVKGKNAIYVNAQEDGQRFNYHLHEKCNKTIAKDKWFSGSGLYRGCIKDAMKASEKLRSINILPDELPFPMQFNNKMEG